MDYISALPFDMIIIIGLALPLVEVATLSRTSRKLAKLYQSEVYWRCKLQQDYASYVPSHRIEITYQKLYRMIHQVFRSRIEDVSLLDHCIMEEFCCDISYLTLIYPVPPFSPIKEKRYCGDIQIITCEGYTFIGMRERQTITGSLPVLKDGIPKIYTAGFDLDFKFYALKDEYFEYGFVDFWCIEQSYLPHFLRRAHRMHYMQLDALGKCEEIKLQKM